MTNKNFPMAISLATLLWASNAFATEFEVDAAHSSVRFEVKHLGIATVDGKFKQFSGAFAFDEKSIEKSSGEGKVQIKSVDTGIDARDNHLRSDDFFSVEKFPEARFKTKKVVSKNKDSFTVVGDLTIRDKTKEVTFDAKYLGKSKGMDGVERAAFEASTQVNRFDFGLGWNKVVESMPVVSKEVKITIHVEAAPKK